MTYNSLIFHKKVVVIIYRIIYYLLEDTTHIIEEARKALIQMLFLIKIWMILNLENSCYNKKGNW